MLDPHIFYKELRKKRITFFSGVPDSLLKHFCSYIEENVEYANNIIAANEGNAIGIAAGYYLSTGEIPLVYMQNSGLGNAINPLVSLVGEQVYNIPLLLLIGWRGEPGKEDACQHLQQGNITLPLLKTLDIPHSILPDTKKKLKEVLSSAYDYMKDNSAPYAIVVRKDTFTEYISNDDEELVLEMDREEAIRIVIENLQNEDIVVSSTGKISREVFEIREKLNQSHEKDFLVVGSMGHVSQVAFGIAINNLARNIYCLEGDGSFLMHMGGVTTIAKKEPDNFKHIILNNGAHDSVGGQATAGFNLDIELLARGAGYQKVFKAKTKSDLMEKLNFLKQSQGPSLLEIKIKKNSRKDLGRPTINAKKRKNKFMHFLQGKQN